MNDGMSWRRLTRLQSATHMLMTYTAQAMRDNLLRLPDDDRGIIFDSCTDPHGDLEKALRPGELERESFRFAVGELLADRYLVLEPNGGPLVIRNFGIHQAGPASEGPDGTRKVRKTDAERQRERRQRLAAERDAASQSVTDCHDSLSREAVTPSHDTECDEMSQCHALDQIREDQNRSESCDAVTRDVTERDTVTRDTVTPKPVTRSRPRDPTAESYQTAKDAGPEVIALWEAYRANIGDAAQDAVLDSKRIYVLSELAKTGATAAQVATATRGAMSEDWSRIRIGSLPLLFGSRNQFEKYLALGKALCRSVDPDAARNERAEKQRLEVRKADLEKARKAKAEQIMFESMGYPNAWTFAEADMWREARGLPLHRYDPEHECHQKKRKVAG